jgi:hypothetical protein
MSRVAPRPLRPRLTLLPADGDRVCLFDAILDNHHDHGTILGVRVARDGAVSALVQWDDDAENVEAGWCDLDALGLRCAIRETNTRAIFPRLNER